MFTFVSKYISLICLLSNNFITFFRCCKFVIFFNFNFFVVHFQFYFGLTKFCFHFTKKYTKFADFYLFISFFLLLICINFNKIYFVTFFFNLKLLCFVRQNVKLFKLLDLGVKTNIYYTYIICVYFSSFFFFILLACEEHTL